MPVYEYQCAVDGYEESANLSAFQYEAIRNIPRICPNGHVLGRKYTFTTTREISKATNFEPHLSIATGQEVSSHHQLKEQLKALSQEQSERMGGMPVNLVPIDPRELKPVADGRAESYTERKRPVPTSGGFYDSKPETLAKVHQDARRT